MTLDKEKTEWQAVWRITASVLTPDKVKMNDNQYICIFKITELLRTLSLVDRCVKMRVCKQGCDVLDLCVFSRIIL